MQIIRTVLGLLGAATVAAAVPAVTIKGSYFVNNATGDRFQIVGVAYQPGGSAGYNPGAKEDPLSDKSTCLRDAALMQMLGVNAIRVYNVDPDINHDECASIFNAAGMYMLIDVNSPLAGESLNSGNPGASYYAQYLNRTFAVVEAFKNYTNTAAFFAGNEVMNNVDDITMDPPYIRAVIRDLRQYVKNHATRPIPVGYSATDKRDFLVDTLNYLQCTDSDDGTSDDGSQAEFYSLNSYSWCGNSTFQESTYEQLVTSLSKSSLPVFFSEYGCNSPYPRYFGEVPVLYSDQMNVVFSGGIVFEYAQGINNYGLVNISSDGSAQLKGDYYTLKDQLSSLNFTDVQSLSVPSNSPTPPVCAASLITTTGFTTDFNIPALPPNASAIIEGGVSPAPSSKIVTILNYTVTQTIKDNNGNVLSDIKVVPLTDDQINQPGSNTQSAGTPTSPQIASGNGNDTTSSSSPTSSKKSGADGTRHARGESMWFFLMSALAACFAVGLIG